MSSLWKKILEDAVNRTPEKDTPSDPPAPTRPRSPEPPPTPAPVVSPPVAPREQGARPAAAPPLQTPPASPAAPSPAELSRQAAARDLLNRPMPQHLDGPIAPPAHTPPREVPPETAPHPDGRSLLTQRSSPDSLRLRLQSSGRSGSNLQLTKEQESNIRGYLRLHVPPEIISPFSVDPDRHKILREVIDRAIRAKMAGDITVDEETITQIHDQLIGLGPLEQLLRNPETTEVLVQSWNNIAVEQHGYLHQLEHVEFDGPKELQERITQMVALAGKEIDALHPFVNFSFPDGTRVNAVIPPVARSGATLAIRRAKQKTFSLDTYIANDSFDQLVADFLRLLRRAHCPILVSGSTGSGKTSLVETLISLEKDDFLVVCEEVPELKPDHPNLRMLVVPSESKSITLRQIVQNALRMRPDSIIVGEIRGAETADLLNALSSGHAGGMTTIHADTSALALRKLEVYSQMSEDSPFRHLGPEALREIVYASFEFIVQVTRTADGSRRLKSIDELVEIRDGHYHLANVFTLVEDGVDEQGRLQARWVFNERYQPSERTSQRFRSLGMTYHLKRSRMLDIGRSQTFLNAGRVHLSNHNFVEAAKSFQEGLRLNPYSPDLRAALEQTHQNLSALGLAQIVPPPPKESMNELPVDDEVNVAIRRALEYIMPVALSARGPKGGSGPHVTVNVRETTKKSDEAIDAMIIQKPVSQMRQHSRRQDVLLSAGEAAKLLGVTRYQLYKLEKEGRISPMRSASNERRYTGSELERLRAELAASMLEELTPSAGGRSDDESRTTRASAPGRPGPSAGKPGDRLPSDLHEPASTS